MKKNNSKIKANGNAGSSFSLENVYTQLKDIVERMPEVAGKGQCRKLLTQVDNRRKDKTLRAAVIGEFNAGKSTFINALLRQKLLKDGVMPTTAASTHIMYAKGSDSIVVHFSNGKVLNTLEEINSYLSSVYSREVKDFQNAVTALTSEQNIAIDVTRLDINLSCGNNQLPDFVQLVDTPGFNPGREEVSNHFEVTRKVVEEYADLAIVLIPACAAMSNTLLSFLESHIRAYLHRCVFVVTKVDLLSQEDLTRVVDMVKITLSRRLNLQNPNVFSVSARTVLPVPYLPPEMEAMWKVLRNEFFSVERKMWKVLSEGRKAAIKASLSRLMTALSEMLNGELSVFGKKLEEIVSILERNKLQSVQNMTNCVYETGVRRLGAFYNSIDYSDSYYLSRCKSECHSIVKAGGLLSSFDSNEGSRISTEVAKYLELYSTSVQKKIKEACDILKEITNDFIDEFNRHYKDMPALRPRLRSRYSWKQRDEVSFSIADMSEQARTMNDDITNSAKGGTVVGAAIGTFVMPGFGTLVGGLIGAIFGFFASPNPEDIQQRVIETLDPKIEDAFSSLKRELKKEAERSRKNQLQLLNKMANEHIDTYAEKVEMLIQEQEKKEAECRRKLEEVSKDVNTLSSIKHKLNNNI